MRTEHAPVAGRPRDQRVDKAIANAALDLFVEGGLAAVTFLRVAARAGTSRSVLYRRFRTREQVLLAALEARPTEGDPLAEDWPDAEEWANLPSDDVVDAFVERTAAVLCDARSMALLARLVGTGPEGARLRATYWQTVVVPRRATFDHLLIAAGFDGDPATATMLEDQLSGTLLHRALLDPTPLDLTTATAYVDTLFQTLGLRHAGRWLPSKREHSRVG